MHMINKSCPSKAMGRRRLSGRGGGWDKMDTKKEKDGKVWVGGWLSREAFSLKGEGKRRRRGEGLVIGNCSSILYSQPFMLEPLNY